MTAKKSCHTSFGSMPNQNLGRCVMHHAACQIEQNGTVLPMETSLSTPTTLSKRYRKCGNDGSVTDFLFSYTPCSIIMFTFLIPHAYLSFSSLLYMLPPHVAAATPLLRNICLPCLHLMFSYLLP